MLRYLGMGQRRLGDFPMPAHRRINWEFFAILRGRLAPFVQLQQHPPPGSSALWLFPPGTVHGWIGEPGRSSEVVVIHFSTVPLALEKLVREHGQLVARLTAADRKFVRRLGRDLHRHYWHPVRISELCIERALIDLSLLMLRRVGVSRQPVLAGITEKKIVEAENWFRKHLAESDALPRAARACGLSPSHLRRLFQRVRGLTPKDALQRLRFEHAMSLMAQSNLKLAAVAVECGFTTAGSFCRAFRAFNGSSPARWRRQIFMQYRQPSADTAADPRGHGRQRRPP
ncbi:MAG TPA: AraC family transcriptional regulator [Opitutaceae bacterium]|nr:AraC family transcriptional regulator [Opitutaceae bacterium]